MNWPDYVMSYRRSLGAGTARGSCSMSYSIAGVEPSGTGPYVFIDIVGTSETYDNAAAMAAVNDMVSQGDERHGELEQGRQPAVAHQLHDQVNRDAVR